MDVSLQYDKIGKDYVNGQKEFFSKREDEAIKFIKKSIPELKNKKILDLGCGNGKDIILYQSLGAEVYGIDSSEFMINEAKKIISKSKVFKSNLEKTPFENNFFDIIVSRFSFHYLKNFDKAYKEISRILKKDGSLILVVHHPLRDLSYQKNKIYGKQETIKIELYNNKVPIYFPTHTLKNYFSRIFFDHFHLINYEEEQIPEEYINEFKTPGFMGIVAKKS